ncbi:MULTISPECIES: amidase [unclassified Brevibacterium]|uniref:amidase n=1 Tax=unclassified Brevibacterium TaxID=2614124 RepID=UPI0010F88EBE|nr:MULTISPECIES: amidase [unclassified Brevibacterium]MCM1013020.1 amidase [Brevibacterium sp. XM4083]
MTELWALSATEVLARFRTKDLSPVDYLEALIARIEEKDPDIGAVTEIVEEAAASARDAERFYVRTRPEELDEVLAMRPLAGLPVIAKEKHALAGHTISQGLVAECATIAVEDAAVIRRIRDAGGYIHARAASPEFSCATVTHSPLWGVTRNPWHRDLSPGGSSGGSGAALAAGFAPLATASDIAGSTRLPAAFTGTVGFKAPYGRIPGQPPLAADWYRGDGPMARTVADTALLARVMAGRDPSDHATIDSPDHLAGLPSAPAEVVAGLKGLRIAVCLRLGDFPVGDDIARNTSAVAAALAFAEADVEEVVLPWTADRIFETAFAHFGAILAPAMRAATRGHEDTLADYTLQFMADAEAVAARRPLVDGLALEAEIQSELTAALSGFDVLLAPTSAVAALLADASYLDGIRIGADGIGREGDGAGLRLDHYWKAHMTMPFNIGNRVPVVNVPSGMADCGIPTGIQVIGRPFDDRTAFAVAAAIELLRPWTGLAPD